MLRKTDSIVSDIASIKSFFLAPDEDEHNDYADYDLDYRELKKLSEESLTRQPEEVFDILSKLGEGSYGSVFKAIHKESSQVLAIKQVPVDTDLQEIIKEISIMQQCDSPYVVKYYGSYFKNTDLWVRNKCSLLKFCSVIHFLV